MVRDVPPFGGYNDPDFARGVAWIMGFMDPADWKRRAAQIEQNLKTVFERHETEPKAVTHGAVSFADDQIAWYLYLADKALNDPYNYEPSQGARVIPIFQRLGTDLELLKSIGGVEDRIRRLLTAERRQPDPVLFELLAALLWRRNGYDPVEFLEERPSEKTPDFRARHTANEWFVECKRLQKSSNYSERERLKWLAMWTQFRGFLTGQRYSAVFDIVFHVELETLPDDFLLKELPGKLCLVHLPCDVIANEIWTVSAKPVDYRTAREHLARYYVRYPSTQANELIGGRRDPNRGFTATILGKFMRAGAGLGNNQFLDELGYAAGVFWSCDAQRAIERKARDIRGHLAAAVEQLPDQGKCAIHVGMETLEGTAVEMTRILRIFDSVDSFDALGKDLRWIYCHQFQSYAPPDEAWAIDETVHHFGRSRGSGPRPLSCQSLVVPQSENFQDGVHWQRTPP
jgi:hypothetical protein